MKCSYSASKVRELQNFARDILRRAFLDQVASTQEQVKLHRGRSNCGAYSPLTKSDHGTDSHLIDLISHIGKVKHNWLIEEQIRQGEAYRHL